MTHDSDIKQKTWSLATPKIYEADFDNEKTFVIVMEPTVGARAALNSISVVSCTVNSFISYLFYVITLGFEWQRAMRCESGKAN